MRSLPLSIFLGIAALGVAAAMPSAAEARGRHGGWGSWYQGRWRGHFWYPRWGRRGYYPYAAFYYPRYYSYPAYSVYYPTYAYYPPTDYSSGASFYSLPDSASGGTGSAKA